MVMTPVWFGPTDRPLFGWFHSGLSGKARAGVVICPPFGLENIRAHYALRLTAERLAEHEIAVLRFDYDGMGDSAGDISDPDRVGSWLRSVTAAINVVRTAGIKRISLVGMRIGATMAVCAAADNAEIDQVVLWDPCMSGRAFLREQEAMSAISLGITTKHSDGSVETPGLVYGSETVRDLRTLRIEASGWPKARRVLVLTRPDREVDRSAIVGLGSEIVQFAEAAGQRALMDVGAPFQRLPYETIGKIADWISKGYDGVTVPFRTPSMAGEAMVGTDREGRSIVERPLAIPPGGLFGMLTEVAGAGDEGPVVLFLSVANQHHIGPDRLWVQLSRRWAAWGLRCLRLDLSGLGDSPVRSAEQEEFVVWAKESFADVTDAAQAVAPDDPSQVVLVGLCASAYQAIESAIDLRPAGVVAVNPLLSFSPPEVAKGSSLDPRRRIALPRNPMIDAFQDGNRLSLLRQKFPNLGWWLRLWAKPKRRPSTWLGTIVGNGTDLLIVAGEREARPIRLGAGKRLLTRLSSSGHFRFEYISDLEHGLLINSQREQVADLLTDHVVERFAPRALAAGLAEAAPIS